MCVYVIKSTLVCILPRHVLRGLSLSQAASARNNIIESLRIARTIVIKSVSLLRISGALSARKNRTRSNSVGYNSDSAIPRYTSRDVELCIKFFVIDCLK